MLEPEPHLRNDFRQAALGEVDCAPFGPDRVPLILLVSSVKILASRVPLLFILIFKQLRF